MVVELADRPASSCAVSFQDLEFERVLVRAYTYGILHYRSVQVRMPKIPQSVLKSTFFLYETAEAAESAADPKGTGFIVFLPSRRDPRRGIFIGITNWHVSTQIAPVVRLNKRDGTSAIFDFDTSEWTYEPRGDDISYIHLPVDQAIHDITAVPFGLFATEEWVTGNQVGVGDDAFMFGLFVDSRHHSTNIPAARFGNISMVSCQVKQATGCLMPSIVVDMHSRTGFSGSPVFVYRTIGSNLDHANSTNLILSQDSIFAFLGLHWGQFPEEWKVAGQTLSEPDRRFWGMSGLTMVVPAWRIRRMIMSDTKIAAIMTEAEKWTIGDASPPPFA